MPTRYRLGEATDEFLRSVGSKQHVRRTLSEEEARLLARLGHFTARHRWLVISVWIVLTLFGGFAAGKVSKRWYQSFSIPGKSAYETSQKTLHTFGTGVRPPNLVVFHEDGDATASPAIEAAMKRAADTVPGARTSSWFTTHNPMYVSQDKHTTF